MAHPYKEHADKSHKSKTGNMGRMNNLDIPVMRAVGENRAGGMHESSSHMQHMKQSAATGMKKGGHVGKPKHHKPAVVIAPPAPPPDPAAAMAGAAPGGAPPPPGAMPPGAPPMQKRGGKVTGFARGGKVTGQKGGDNGEGRLDKIKMYGLKPIKGHGE